MNLPRLDPPARAPLCHTVHGKFHRVAFASVGRTALSSAMTLAVAASVVAIAIPASANELALAQGAITLRDAPAGQRSVACNELIVEERDALDNHLIGSTHAASDSDGACRYALSVPAQAAVWLRVRPALVSAAGPSEAIDAPRIPSYRATANTAAVSSPQRTSTASVQLRFRIVAPSTYFFAPGERKNVDLTY